MLTPRFAASPMECIVAPETTGPGGFAIELDPLSTRVLLDLMAELGKEFFRMLEELVDFLLAALIPASFWQPATEGIGEIDLTLAGDDPVWQKWEATFEQALDHLRHRAAGVDAPDDALFLAELADELEKSRWDGRDFGRVMQRAVEIEGKDRGGRRRGE